MVPFGRGNKPIEGFVFNICDNSDVDESKLKEVIDILDEEPVFSRDQLNLVKWMRNRYLCTYMDCINLIYPKGLKVKNYRVVYPGKMIKGKSEAEIMSVYDSLDKDERYILDLITTGKGMVKEEKLNNIENIKNLIYRMKKKKLITIKWEYKSNKNEKKLCYVSLSAGYKDIENIISDKKIRVGKRQSEIIEFLNLNGEVEINDLMSLLGVLKSSVDSLYEKGLLEYRIEDFYRRPESSFTEKKKEIKLNEEQKNVSEIIKNEMFDENKKPYILHGVTGSGKTEVYMDIMEYTLSQGMDCILLVPEISLAPQTVARIKNRFGDIVGVFHSQLSEGERHDVFRAVKNGEIRILIGARSALFAPFTSLGTVIIDEFHESAYKSEKNPKFSTIEVARYMAYRWGITMVMGSATPSVDEYYRGENGDYKILKITKRANNMPMPKISVVDMKSELSEGNRSIFSKELISELKKTIVGNSQAILFLNRRGFANFISCRKCGYVMKCLNCDISLTYHKVNNSARCHYCGHEEAVPEKCPECGSKYLKSFGAGTQRIEDEIKKIIPGVRTLRMDKDTTSKKGAYEEILGKFSRKEADVLIGTQMVAKGLDFENVTLVGVMSADMMLNFPDFKSFEGTFQMITQVSGRAGRSDREGKVILQTYNTDHYAIKSAVDYDFESFYKDEIKIRKAFEYSPFCNMMSVVISGHNENIVKKNAFGMYNSLVYLLRERGYENTDFILGPNRCALSRINGNYRWQLLFKDDGVEINLLKGIIRYVCITKRDSVFDKDVNVSIDINPNNIL